MLNCVYTWVKKAYKKERTVNYGNYKNLYCGRNSQDIKN